MNRLWQSEIAARRHLLQRCWHSGALSLPPSRLAPFKIFASFVLNGAERQSGGLRLAVPLLSVLPIPRRVFTHSIWRGVGEGGVACTPSARGPRSFMQAFNSALGRPGPRLDRMYAGPPRPSN
jgi:hypothetical protein